jgi:cellulose synthase/poly-beta-1,6-N-acetylglucosamine synthase-like glycosyltransferase
LHLEDWPGFKSGALNFALTQTAADAEIIAVIDADYIVDPAFLKDLVPAFVNPEIAFIQTPQDYREVNGEPFLDAIYHSYRYFFDVSMPVRNEHNAIIFCGTMGLIRKSALEAIGGWDEWCITEDAEASLRILKQGYQSLYLNRTYGRGLLPYTFDGLKKQRFRWAFGGIQLLKKHWESLMPWSKSVEPENRLTGSQKYYFLSSGLQWLTDILNLLFAVFLALGGLLTIFTGQFTIRPLTGPMIILPAVFLLLNMSRFLWLLKTILKLPWCKALRSMYSFFSLSWVIALATIQGLVQSGGVFLRTPKSKGRSKVAQALASTRWEMLLGLAVLLIGISVWIVRPSIPAALLALMLVWQSSIYLSAPAFSLSAARSNLPAYLRGGQEGAPLWEGRAARWAAGMVVGAIVLVGLIQGLPQPTTASYTRYQPPQVSAQSLVERKEKPPKGENGKGNQNKDNNGNGKGKGKP